MHRSAFAVGPAGASQVPGPTAYHADEKQCCQRDLPHRDPLVGGGSGRVDLVVALSCAARADVGADPVVRSEHQDSIRDSISRRPRCTGVVRPCLCQAVKLPAVQLAGQELGLGQIASCAISIDLVCDLGRLTVPLSNLGTALTGVGPCRIALGVGRGLDSRREESCWAVGAAVV